MGISHDSVTRFLHREAYTPLDLFKEVRGTLNLKGGTKQGCYHKSPVCGDLWLCAIAAITRYGGHW